MKLNGAQHKSLRLALETAYPSRPELELMVREELEYNLNLIAGDDPLPTVIARLIRWAEARGRVMELIIASCRGNTDNPDLRRFAESAAVPTLESDELERIVLKHVPFHNLLEWIDNLIERSRAVCRIEAILDEQTGEFQPVGSGFLVGPNAVMTNRHVVDEIEQKLGVLDNRQTADRVGVRFDATSDDSEGFRAILAEPAVKRLSGPDIATLALEPATADEGGGVRTPMTLDPAPLDVGDPLLILQHPRGQALSLTIGSVVSLASADGSIRYTTNTNPGSSGSPCLTTDLRLAAIHWKGATDYNTGILVTDEIRQLVNPPEANRLSE